MTAAVRMPAETPAWRAKFDQAQDYSNVRPLVYRMGGNWFFASPLYRSAIEPLRDSRRRSRGGRS